MTRQDGGVASRSFRNTSLGADLSVSFANRNELRYETLLTLSEQARDSAELSKYNANGKFGSYSRTAVHNLEAVIHSVRFPPVFIDFDYSSLFAAVGLRCG